METITLPALRSWPRAGAGLERERWLAGVLLVMVASVFSYYVIVLQQDVRHADLMHAQALARAQALAECEESPPPARVTCIAMLEGPGSPDARAAATPRPQPENDLLDRRPRAAVATADAGN